MNAIILFDKTNLNEPDIENSVLLAIDRIKNQLGDERKDELRLNFVEFDKKETKIKSLSQLSVLNQSQDLGKDDQGGSYSDLWHGIKKCLKLVTNLKDRTTIIVISKNQAHHNEEMFVNLEKLNIKFVCLTLFDQDEIFEQLADLKSGQVFAVRSNNYLAYILERVLLEIISICIVDQKFEQGIEIPFHISHQIEGPLKLIVCNEQGVDLDSTDIELISPKSEKFQLNLKNKLNQLSDIVESEHGQWKIRLNSRVKNVNSLNLRVIANARSSYQVEIFSQIINTNIKRLIPPLILIGIKYQDKWIDNAQIVAKIIDPNNLSTSVHFKQMNKVYYGLVNQVDSPGRYNLGASLFCDNDQVKNLQRNVLLGSFKITPLMKTCILCSDNDPTCLNKYLDRKTYKFLIKHHIKLPSSIEPVTTVKEFTKPVPNPRKSSLKNKESRIGKEASYLMANSNQCYFSTDNISLESSKSRPLSYPSSNFDRSNSLDCEKKEYDHDRFSNRTASSESILIEDRLEDIESLRAKVRDILFFIEKSLTSNRIEKTDQAQYKDYVNMVKTNIRSCNVQQMNEYFIELKAIKEKIS